MADIQTAPPRLCRPIETVTEAEELIAHLCDVMDALLGLIEEETALVRAGRLADANKLEPAKGEMAALYVADTERLKANGEILASMVPTRFDDLRRRHDTFRAVLQINLTVLATAHAVSESIIRGVAGELARKAAPQTYGLSGRPNAPGKNGVQPVAVSRRF